MGLLDKATLITTPTAHSNGKLHSIKGGAVADFDVVRGSVATRVASNGLIESVATNIPRIDYTTGEGVILTEPQSTNLIAYSEDFSQWTPTGTPTITSTYGVSPDGTLNSTRVQFSSNERIRSSFSASGDITFSVYMKGSGIITLRDNTNVYRQDVTLTSEWVKYDLSFNATITSVQVQNQTASVLDCEIWGAQVEALPYSTSYIPTSGAIATRLADSLTGAGDATTFNSTEGVLYAEIAALADDGTYRIFSINDGSRNNRVYLQYINTSNALTAVVKSSNITQANIQVTVADSTDFIKVAVKYKQNDFALWVNGVKVGIDTSGSAPIGLSNLSLNDGASNPFYGKTKTIAAFSEALTDEELTCLTTI